MIEITVNVLCFSTYYKFVVYEPKHDQVSLLKPAKNAEAVDTLLSLRAAHLTSPATGRMSGVCFSLGFLSV